MAEKLTFDSPDAIPQGLRDSAKEENGKYVLSVVPSSKLDEFRNNNIKLAQERDGLVQRIQKYGEVIGEDFDTFRTEYEQMRDLYTKVKDKELIDNSSFEEALKTRTEGLRSDMEGKIKGLSDNLTKEKTRADTYEQKFKRTIVDQAITGAVLSKDSGARTEALPDILSRAYSNWKVDQEGNVRAFDDKGNVIYGSDGASPMTPQEWVNRLRDQAPYFFKDSEGGGASGGGGGSSYGAVRSKSDLKTAADKAAFIREHGQDVYLKLPK